MKTRRGVLLFLLFVVLATRVMAMPQSPYTLYLPAVIMPPMDGTMGLWSYVEPTAIINRVPNPSIGINTTGWTNAGMATMTQSSAEQKFGVYSLLCLANSMNDQVFIDAGGFTAAASVTASAWVLSTSSNVRLTLLSRPGGINLGSASHSGSGEWERLVVTGTLSGGETIARLVIIDARAAAWDNIYVDGVQAEERSSVTTYCDGTLPGCEWNGAAHASTSTRSALSRAGGVVTDFEDLSFDIGGMFGAGMSPITVNVDSFAILPGGEVNSIKTDERTFTLSGWVSGTSLEDLHAKRQAIIDALKPNAVPNNQPVLLRYTGAAITKEIAATYEAGLAGTIRGEFPCLEQNFVLRFLATDPNWYEIGNSAAVLVTEDTATLRYIAGRLRSTGQWDDLGLTANPTADGLVLAVLVASDGSVYFAGLYDGIDGNVPAGGDYIIRYDPQDQSLNLLVGASDLNGRVNVISEGPDGIIYIGGVFTAVNGVGTADYIVSYDPVADTWASLGDPDSGAAAITSVNAMAWDSLGNLYIGGNFQNFANVANADYFAQWTTAGAWAAVGAPLAGAAAITRCGAIAIDRNDNIYVGGTFTRWADVADADYWALWTAGAWTTVNGIALVANVNAMAFDGIGVLYVGGDFLNADGNANADYIFKWTGAAIVALSTGMDNSVNSINIAPDDAVWISGQFTVAGDVTLLDRLVLWNGSAFAPPSLNLPGAPIVYDVDFSNPDPVVSNNYDVYIGFTTTGAGFFSGTATATNDGTEDAYPVIAVSRAGGTSAILKTVRNETLGLELLFNYVLRDGETLTIDLSPTSKSIVSSFSGSALQAVLPNSDLGTWHLGSGANQITCFVDVVGAPAVVGTMTWKDPYWSAD